MTKANDDERAREARRILDRVERDSETAGFSSTARIAEKARDNLAEMAVAEVDPIEVLGKKIGRVLSVIAVAILVYYLYSTYFS